MRRNIWAKGLYMRESIRRLCICTGILRKMNFWQRENGNRRNRRSPKGGVE